jgi:hypothetical protein
VTGQFIGKAYAKGYGLCYVEHLGGDQFRLTPLRNPYNRIIRPRGAFQWRKTTRQETAS